VYVQPEERLNSPITPIAISITVDNTFESVKGTPVLVFQHQRPSDLNLLDADTGVLPLNHFLSPSWHQSSSVNLRPCAFQYALLWVTHGSKRRKAHNPVRSTQFGYIESN